MANSSMYFNCTIDVSSSHHIHWHASECMNTTIFKVHANVNCHLLIIFEHFVFSLCLCWCHHLISVYMRAQCNPVCFSCPSSDSLCWLVSLSVTQMIHRLVYIDSKGFNTNVPSLVQKQCVSSVPSCRIGSCIGGEEVQIHECPQFGTNRKCMCVLSVPSCRLDVDIRVSAGLTSDQHVTIINVWYNNAHGVHPFVELQISTSPEATPSTGDVSSISSQSLGPAKRVEHLPSSVNMVCHFATSKTNAVQMILY